MYFYRIVFTLLAALSIQSASANQDRPGLVDDNGYTADQSGLLAGLYTAKVGFFQTSTDALRTNEEMSRMFIRVGDDLRSSCGDYYVNKREWMDSYWAMNDKYAAAYVLYEKQADSDLSSLDLSIRQLKAQERPECAHLTQELINVRNSMVKSWGTCSDDYTMLKADWHKTAYAIESADGHFYVREAWLDEVQSCHDRSYARRNAYQYSYTSLEDRMDKVINGIRACYRLNL